MNATTQRATFGLVQFLTSYIEAALWASCDDDGEPLDKTYNRGDIAPETLERMREDCATFLRNHAEAIGFQWAQAGHDLWLSRNGHGAGFFDGDWGDDGDSLQEAARKCGSFDLYVGDDGMIYGN